jgi:site-specific recombinase XerD
MTNTAFDWQIDEFMIYCRSRQLREKTMLSYEQTLRLFERWCKEQLNIEEVDKVTESVPVCRYVPAWANAQVPKTVDMFLSGIGRTGMRYVPVISFSRAMSRPW